jgi:hypothetical protein
LKAGLLKKPARKIRADAVAVAVVVEIAAATEAVTVVETAAVMAETVVVVAVGTAIEDSAIEQVNI